MNSGEIDVVIPVRNEALKLKVCCEALLRHIPVRSLIIVVGESKDESLRISREFANIVVQDENKGIGHARALGLKKVESEFYASIDSDVVISESWYKFCRAKIDDPKVGACEGLLWPIGANYRKVLKFWSESWTKELSNNPTDETSIPCSLGNTILRTKVVKEVGMPLDRWGEDQLLRKRLSSKGWRWIVDLGLLTTHLVSDVEILKHALYWSKFKKMEGTFLIELGQILKDFIDPQTKRALWTYLLLLRVVGCYGFFRKSYADNSALVPKTSSAR
jgi:glycosyltransferase involved in cell wall biosynthesis